MGETSRINRGAEVVAVVAALVSVGATVYNVVSDRQEHENARKAEARAARHDIVANVLELGQYDADEGARNQHEILVLAADSMQLIDDFGQDRLRLSPVIYRQLAEYVSYSTRNTTLADRLARAVLKYASSDDPDELVTAHRVLGDLAARDEDPDVFEEEYELAVASNGGSGEDQRPPSTEIDRFTRVHRLLSAYLGASLSEDDEVRVRFCSFAEGWQDDLPLIERLAHNERVASQLRRLDANEHVDRVGAACT